MPSTREIRRRIASIRNTQKITRAMEMVASVKLRKSRAQILNVRPYADKLAQIAGHLQASTAHDQSVLLTQRPSKKVSLLVVTSDKGLCGGFNANVLKAAVSYVRKNSDKEVTLTLLGKKSIDFFRRRQFTVAEKYPGLFIKPTYSEIANVAEKALDDFLSGRCDAVDIVFNEFRGAASQRTVVRRLLPVPAIAPPTENHTGGRLTDYIFEPDAADALDAVLGRAFVFGVWRIGLESYAAEQGARMTAMNGATKNAGEIINKLTLFYNKARQASITKELLEVVAGAESLR